jgi:hypothetical protein
MNWRKLGIVYCPDGRTPWAQTHAMIPTPVLLDSDTIRVFVTMCDGNFVGRPGYVDVDAHNPTRVLRVSDQPLLDVGQPGTFDENGMLTCSVVPLDDGRMFMYYAGFEQGTKIRYRLLTGLAVSHDGGKTFARVKETPVLERSPQELFFRGGPFVIHENGVFKMWYVAGSGWEDVGGKQMPVYVVRYLESDNGIDWGGHGALNLDITNEDEHGFGRPWVLKKPDGGMELFYSVRRRSFGQYRLGYAESGADGTWIRKDNEIGLDCTPGTFDSEAIMYLATIRVGDRTFGFYNGNGFGRDGFAVAERIEA